ncbi:MAG: trehalose 6-phosphate synthase [Acidimicrobiaceae bacterium]|jgi:trehalose 6-phosphate synthase|nr:trehalose 6-phosphate synthase [Acidimicrobiaceae bacterium]
MGRPDLVIASNRGPLSFRREADGRLEPTRGAGGLVSSIGPLIEDTGATWVAAAMSDDDRAGAAAAANQGVRLLDIDTAVYRQAYDVVSNATLWFLHHGLYDLARRPVFDRHWRQAWAGYRTYNECFANAVAEAAPDGGVVLVQDYHLSLVPALLAERRPDLRTVHFSHTPFADPSALRALPTAEELLQGLAAAASCGFHARRWAANFEACCRDVLGTSASASASLSTFVSPIAPDPDDIGSVASSPECEAEAKWVERVVGNGKLILRVDRIELSKNIVRGFLAYELLLEERPEWRGQVVFVALVYPSRQTLAQYQAYRQEVETVVRRVNDRFGVEGWTPIVLDAKDNFARSVAALQRYDVLLVNPVRDGLNLVAKEGPLVNRCDGVVALSREAGVWDELADAAVGVNPFDIAETADALAAALTMPAGERARRAAALVDAVRSREPQDWLNDQLEAAGPEGS